MKKINYKKYIENLKNIDFKKYLLVIKNKNYKQYIAELDRKKALKIVIPIVFGLICIIGIGIGVHSKFSHSKITSITINQNSGTVEDEITTYFTDNPLSKPLWYFKDNKNTAWIMSYKKGSLKQDASDKEKLIAKINLKEYSNLKEFSYSDKAPIIIHLDSHKFGNDSKKAIWKQITSEINKAGYENKSDSFSISDVKEFIDNWFIIDKTTWYEITNNNKISFTAGNVKINSDGAFTTTLKPSTTKDGNKDVNLVLKWINKENPDNIISAIKAAGYLNTKVLISSMVAIDVNAYLDVNEWANKGSGEIPYNFIATKVVGTFSTKWTVTIDQKKSLKTRNLDFKPFDITLDWKDQKDATDKVSEIDTQIKDGPHYIKLLNANEVRTIFTNSLESGEWDFTPAPNSPNGVPNGGTRQIHPKIDINTTNQGVTPSLKSGNTWNVRITFPYTITYEQWPYTNRWYFTYHDVVGLQWVLTAPDSAEIAKNAVQQLNLRTGFTFKFTPSK